MTSAVESLVPDGELSLSNDLGSSTSSYLRAHKDNPVAWQQWSASSICLAKRYDRLIFLSIGYSACHWCHVMERESFSSPEVAKVLNVHFIPIKVDREARPDIDDIYMNYVTATTGGGGWPLSVFLTPNLEPVFGGTYWPGPGSNSLPRLTAGSDEQMTFMDILAKMRDVWETQHQRCIQSAKEITQQLKDFVAEGSHSHSDAPGTTCSGEPEPLDIDVMDDAFVHFMARYDPTHGGFSPSSPSPKFPAPANLTFLLRIGAAIATTGTRFGFSNPIPSILGEEACSLAASMSLHTLVAMSRGGLRDHVGYGFHRYSVTTDWNLPHFEKMLYDNAQLLSCYCDAWALSHDPEILGTIYSLVDYLTSEDSPIVNVGGGLFASEDADSPASQGSGHDEKREGAFYVWTLKELQNVLTSERDVNLLARHYGATGDGNIPYEHDPHDEFMGQNVLHLAATPSVLAKEFGISEAEVVNIIKQGRQQLKAYRESARGRPAVDEKIIAGWNGLAIAALCRASATLRHFDSARSRDCEAAAVRTAKFVRRTMYNAEEGTLKRYYSPRISKEAENLPAYLDDYAYMTHACLVLYDATFEEEWLRWADTLQNTLNDHFASPTGGYHMISSQTSSKTDKPGNGDSDIAQPPILNLKPGSDNSLPSPNGIVAANLLLLSSYLAQLSYRALAKKTIDAFAVELIQHPFLFVSLLSAIVLEAVGIKSVVVIGDTDVDHLHGFGRTVVKLKDKHTHQWLRGWNALLGGLDGAESEQGRAMICEAGICRDLKAGDFD